MQTHLFRRKITRRAVELETAYSRLHQPFRKHGKLLQGSKVGFTVRRCIMSRDLQWAIVLPLDVGYFSNQLDQLGQETRRGEALELGVQAEIQRLDSDRMFSFPAGCHDDIFNLPKDRRRPRSKDEQTKD